MQVFVQHVSVQRARTDQIKKKQEYTEREKSPWYEKTTVPRKLITEEPLVSSLKNQSSLSLVDRNTENVCI